MKYDRRDIIDKFTEAIAYSEFTATVHACVPADYLKAALSLINKQRDEIKDLEARIADDASLLTEFADRLKRYYSTLNGGTNSTLVAYHIDQILKEIKEKKE